MKVYGTVPSKIMDKLCDSAVLGMDVTDEKLINYIERFKEYPETSAVVVNFHQIELAMKTAEGSHVLICPVIAYPPFCSVPTELKVAQAKYAVEKYHVPYLLLTIDHSKFADSKYDEVKKDLEAVVKAVNGRAQVIVLADFVFWDEEQCVEIVKIMKEAGVDVVKSTGGLGRVESTQKVRKASQYAGKDIKVMGTSAIKNLEQCLDMVDAHPYKYAISRAAFFDVYEEVHALEKVRLTKEELASKIIGMVWHPTIKEKEVKEYLLKASKEGLYGVSVDPRWVPLAKEVLENSRTKVIARLDYPFGDSHTDLKAGELKWLLANGTSDMEIQTVMNVSAFNSGKYEYVRNELETLVEIANGHKLSVNIQVPLLSKEGIVAAAMICASCGVSAIEPKHGFSKFSPDGSKIFADLVDYLEVRNLKQIVGDKIDIRVTGAIDRVAAALVPLANGAEIATTPDALLTMDNYEVLVKRLEQYM